MKQKALIFLSFYIIALIAPAFTMVKFAIYQEEITERFCENKDKPKLQCNGQCHLSKMLAEQTQQEEEEQVSEPNIEYPIGKVAPLQLEQVFALDENSLGIHYSKALLPAYLIQIDHPPRV